MVAGGAEDGELLADGVQIAEGFIPIFVGGSLGEVPAEYGEIHFRMSLPCLHDLAVRNAADGVLHIAEIEEREITVCPGIFGREAVPRRGLPVCHHTIVITLPVDQVSEPCHVECALAAAGMKHFAGGRNADHRCVVVGSQLQMRGVQHRIALPTHVAGECPVIAEGEQHTRRCGLGRIGCFGGIAEPHIPAHVGQHGQSREQ